MIGTSARLLGLLSLFQGRRSWSGRELAGRMDVTPRTLRRDVDKLRTLGYPIHSATGADGGYRLGSGSVMPPLLLDDEEAVAVALGLRYAASGNVEGIEEASARALVKIEQVLPGRLGRRIAALQSVVMSAGWRGTAVDGGVIASIAAACRDSEVLRFRYQDHQGNASQRIVEPHRLVHTARRWYLVAWDTGRKDWRTFRVDRLEGLRSGGRCEPRKPPAEDLAAWVNKGRWLAPARRATVRVLLPAEELAQRLPAGYGLIEPEGKKSCRVELGAPTWESLALNLVFLGADFEVEKPAELVEWVRELAGRYARAAAG